MKTRKRVACLLLDSFIQMVIWRSFILQISSAGIAYDTSAGGRGGGPGGGGGSPPIESTLEHRTSEGQTS